MPLNMHKGVHWENSFILTSKHIRAMNQLS